MSCSVWQRDSATKAIGQYLCISPHTVSRHIRNLCKKFGAVNSIHLVMIHFAGGLLLQRHPSLTDREHEIVTMLMRGMTTKDVAHAAGISVKTVRKHRENILFKLEVTSMRRVAALFLHV